MPGLNDLEGESVPELFEHVIDTHVHIFPDVFFRAVWKWFDRYGWPIRYKLTTTQIFNFLFSKGVEHVVAFQYAHKPGMASYLNNYMVEIIEQFNKTDNFRGRITGMATVFPGEDGAVDILKKAFHQGLKGVKLHVHVQCFDLISNDMDAIYKLCTNYGLPMVIHAGREPKSPAYSCDPYQLCSAYKVEEIIRSYPMLKLCVPHLGMDEFDEYKSMIERYDNLWLDTAMALTDYLPIGHILDIGVMRSDRIMYGSDFPNIPYSWDRELKALAALNLPDENIKKICWENAKELFSIQF
ncbi:MAG: amidohydrolase [Desulfamplus sp.]|nr:amidohydrolase [Desulfamplus sp.]